MRTLPATALLALAAAGACTKKASSSAKTSDVATPTRLRDESSVAVPAATCKGPNPDSLWRVARPVDPAAPAGAQFAYTIEFQAPTTPGAPVVVTFPGAAGASAIGRDAALPAGWGFVNIDPRGVGCNRVSAEVRADGFYDSDAMADDVVAALGHSGATRLFLHGAAFGSIVASKVAAKLEAKAEFAGRVAGVVLEGALGRAYPDSALPQHGLLRQWNLALKSLPAETRAAFTAGRPGGIEDEAWGRYLSSALPLGTVFDPNTRGLVNPARAAALAATTLLTGGASDPVLERVRNAEAPLPEERKRFFKHVACRELSSLSSLEDAHFERGAFTVERADALCTGIGLSRPFDASRYAFRYDTAYFVGGADPIAPAWQGQAHAAANPNAKRMIVTIARAGTWALSRSLADCAPAVWAGIADKADLKPILEKCALSDATIEVLPAAP